jgi:L-iditol 2-dehydrogenase
MSLGMAETIDAARTETVRRVRELTEGRGADAVILAVAANQLVRPALEATRPGGRTMLFAQTVRSEVGIDPAAICVNEKSLLGSYSASVDLQEESVRFVLGGELDLTRLITHRFPLSRAVEALQLAAQPRADSLKVVVQPSLEGGEGNT